MLDQQSRDKNGHPDEQAQEIINQFHNIKDRVGGAKTVQYANAHGGQFFIEKGEGLLGVFTEGVNRSSKPDLEQINRIENTDHESNNLRTAFTEIIRGCNNFRGIMCFYNGQSYMRPMPEINNAVGVNTSIIKEEVNTIISGGLEERASQKARRSNTSQDSLGTSVNSGNIQGASGQGRIPLTAPSKDEEYSSSFEESSARLEESREKPSDKSFRNKGDASEAKTDNKPSYAERYPKRNSSLIPRKRSGSFTDMVGDVNNSELQNEGR